MTQAQSATNARFRRPRAAPLADRQRRPEIPVCARRASMPERPRLPGPERARARSGWSFPDARAGRPNPSSVHIRRCVPARSRACRRIFRAACRAVLSGSRPNLRDRSPIFEGQARLTMRPHEIIGVLVRSNRCNRRDADDGDRSRPPDHAIGRHHRAPPTAKDLVRAITPPCPIGRPCSSDTVARLLPALIRL